IAIVVLLLTQLLNLLLVPLIAHAGLALSIGLGALVNALWLLAGLLRRGSYQPRPGWGRFALQVFAASAVLALWLLWGAQHFDWLALRAAGARRAGLLALLMLGAAGLYFGALRATGLRLRQMLRR
ncbi:lipid II flippase MurJ, partial [Verminephrobacter aporrectodeae subsp. tuberculatae]